MKDRFSGRSILVTGGTGGLGRAVSLAFLEEGAKVVVTFRDQREFDALKTSAGQDVPRLEGFQIDVTDAEEVKKFIETLVAKDGSLSAFVNTVGGYAGGASLWETEPKTFDRMLSLNLQAGFALLRSVVPVMLRQGSGAIVNVLSKAAVDHAAGASAYVASKTAALAMMDSLAADLRNTGVRVNSIMPSIMDTPANRAAMPNGDFAKWPKTEEIAQVILFLCSEEARVIHGAVVPVYGNS